MMRSTRTSYTKQHHHAAGGGSSHYPSYTHVGNSKEDARELCFRIQIWHIHENINAIAAPSSSSAAPPCGSDRGVLVCNRRIQWQEEIVMAPPATASASSDTSSADSHCHGEAPTITLHTHTDQSLQEEEFKYTPASTAMKRQEREDPSKRMRIMAASPHIGATGSGKSSSATSASADSDVGSSEEGNGESHHHHAHAIVLCSIEWRQTSGLLICSPAAIVLKPNSRNRNHKIISTQRTTPTTCTPTGENDTLHRFITLDGDTYDYSVTIELLPLGSENANENENATGSPERSQSTTVVRTKRRRRRDPLHVESKRRALQQYREPRRRFVPSREMHSSTQSRIEKKRHCLMTIKSATWTGASPLQDEALGLEYEVVYPRETPYADVAKIANHDIYTVDDKIQYTQQKGSTQLSCPVYRVGTIKYWDPHDGNALQRTLILLAVLLSLCFSGTIVHVWMEQTRFLIGFIVVVGLLLSVFGTSMIGNEANTPVYASYPFDVPLGLIELPHYKSSEANVATPTLFLRAVSLQADGTKCVVGNGSMLLCSFHQAQPRKSYNTEVNMWSLVGARQDEISNVMTNDLKRLFLRGFTAMGKHGAHVSIAHHTSSSTYFKMVTEDPGLTIKLQVSVG
jgi:hypothetical protein